MIFRNDIENVAFHQVDSRVGIVRERWFFFKRFHQIPLGFHHGIRNIYLIRNTSHHKIGLLVFKKEKQILEINIGEQVGIHHQNVLVHEIVNKRQSACCAQWLDFLHIVDSDAFFRTILEVAFNLLAQIAQRNPQIIDAKGA